MTRLTTKQYIWIINHSTEESLQISPFLNRHYTEFKVCNCTFHIFKNVALKWPGLITAPTYALCVRTMTVPTITKDSQQQDDATTLPTRSAIPSFTATTDINTIMQAKCLVCTRYLFYPSTIMCQFLLLLYPAYEQASQWAHVNTLRMGSFKFFKRPFPGFLTILTP